MKRYIIVTILALLIIIAVSLYIGHLLGEANQSEPQVITMKEVVYVDKFIPVEKIVTVTQNVTVYRDPSDWQSVDQLTEFLDNEEIVVMLDVDEYGIVKLGACWEMAHSLRDRAALIGMRLETEVLTHDECVLYKKVLGYSDAFLAGLKANNEMHMVCKAEINDVYYLIEPANKMFFARYVNG